MVYGEDGGVILDPDRHVQNVMRTFFETFRKKRSASGVLRHFIKHGIRFPCRVLKGPRKGEIVWDRLLYGRAIQILHNPRYAGIFSFGKIKTKKTSEGTMKYINMPQEKWHAFIRDAHPAYNRLRNGRKIKRYLNKTPRPTESTKGKVLLEKDRRYCKE